MLQVIGLWVLFALPVWSAAYKQAGCDTPSWFGISQVAEDAPGIGLVAKAAPVYDGPSFREVWRPHTQSTHLNCFLPLTLSLTSLQQLFWLSRAVLHAAKDMVA